MEVITQALHATTSSNKHKSEKGSDSQYKCSSLMTKDPSPLLTHPHLLPERQSLTVYPTAGPSWKPLHRMENVDSRSSGPGPPIPRFTRDWKPQYLNQGTWFKHSHTAACSTRYLHPTLCLPPLRSPTYPFTACLYNTF